MNEPHKVQISDARPILSEVSLDEEGFALVHHRSVVRDFYDEEEVKRVYYPEAERLLKEATGAERVFIFDHTTRRRVPGAEDRRASELRQPVARVHVDHTAKSDHSGSVIYCPARQKNCCAAGCRSSISGVPFAGR